MLYTVERRVERSLLNQSIRPTIWRVRWMDKDFKRTRRLTKAIDGINIKYGRDTVRFGVAQPEGVIGRRSFSNDTLDILGVLNALS